MTDKRTLVAFTAADLSEAEIVNSLLIANGLRSMIDNETATAMLDGMVSGNLGVHVIVPESEHARALEIIAEARSVGDLVDEEE
jgi:hypothetical protein